MRRPSEDTYAQLRNLALAGTRVVHIASYEWERVQAFLLALARELNVPLEVWSHSGGLCRFNERGGLDKTDDLTDPIDILARLHPDEIGRAHV